MISRRDVILDRAGANEVVRGVLVLAIRLLSGEELEDRG